MKLSDYINPETASLEQAATVNNVIHHIYMVALCEGIKLTIHPGTPPADALNYLIDLLRDLDTESRYLVEDILEEMMDQEDEGGVI